MALVSPPMRQLSVNTQGKSLAMILKTLANKFLGYCYAKYLSNICGVGRIATIRNHTEFYAHKAVVNHTNQLEKKLD